MYLCKFGQNPSTSSEDNARKPYIAHFKVPPVTLKIRSRSPKSNQLFPSSKQCIYAIFVKIHNLVQKIMHGNEKVDADANVDGIRTKNNISPTLWVGGHNEIDMGDIDNQYISRPDTTERCVCSGHSLLALIKLSTQI